MTLRREAFFFFAALLGILSGCSKSDPALVPKYSFHDLVASYETDLAKAEQLKNCCRGKSPIKTCFQKISEKDFEPRFREKPSLTFEDEGFCDEASFDIRNRMVYAAIANADNSDGDKFLVYLNTKSVDGGVGEDVAAELFRRGKRVLPLLEQALADEHSKDRRIFLKKQLSAIRAKLGSDL